MSLSEDEHAEERDAAAVFDFLEDFTADRERGEERPLSAYLARFPGREAAVAEEYLRQQGRLEATPPRGPRSAHSRSAGEIGPYRLLHALGHGGQGVVHLAEDTRLGRQVALKRLATPFVTEAKRARFRREAESVARLAHPNIAAVLDADLEGDEPYLAMQFVPGRDLATLIAERAEEPCPMRPRDRVALNRLLALFESAALALHAAHDAGLVHRDVKPANLMVTPEGEPVLLDFGLARIADDADTPPAAPLTAEGDVFGTPQYMSPEQLEGRRDLDPRTDVYSLGVTLFEALTGERPFDGADLLRLHRAVRYAPLPVERLRVGGRDLRAVLRVATEKERSSRYASARAFAEDLRRLRESEPVLARPVGPLQRLARWTRREPALAGAIGATIVALLVGLGVSLRLLQKERAALARIAGRGLVAHAESYLDSDPEVALALGLEAAARVDDPRTRSLLLSALETSQLVGYLEAGEVLRSWGVEAFPDGRTIGLFSTPAIERGGEVGGVLLVWDRERNEELRRFSWPRDPVCALALDRAGTVAFIGSSRGDAFAVDTATGAERWRIPSSAEAGPCLALAFDRGTVAIATSDGAVRLVDATSGAILRGASAPAASVGALSFSPDGQRLLGASERPTSPRITEAPVASVWRVDDLSRTELDHGDTIRWAAWSESGSGVVTAGADGRVVRHSLDGAESTELALLRSPVQCLACEPGGSRIAVALEDGGVAVLEEGGVRWLPGAHEGAAIHVSWSPDGAHVGSVGYDNTARVWDVRAGRLLVVGRALMRAIACAFEPDGRVFFTHPIGFRCLRWKVGLPDHVYRLGAHVGAVQHARFLGDGELALTVDADGVARLWSTPRHGHDPALLSSTRLDVPLVEAVFLSDDGRRWLVAGGGRAQRFGVDEEPSPVHPCGPTVAFAPDGIAWATVLGEHLHLAHGTGAPAPVAASFAVDRDARLAFSPDGLRLAIAGQHVRLLDVAGEAIGDPVESGEKVRGLVWSPDGARFAVLREDEVLQEYDGRTGGALGAPERFAHRSVLWTTEGKIGWDERTGGRLGLYRDAAEVLRPEELPRSQVKAVATHPSGWLAAAARDGSFSVYSTRTGALLLRHQAHTEGILDIRFGRDPADGRLLTASRDGTAAVWLVDPRAAGKERSARALTDAEWRRAWRLATGEEPE